MTVGGNNDTGVMDRAVASVLDVDSRESDSISITSLNGQPRIFMFEPGAGEDEEKKLFGGDSLNAQSNVVDINVKGGKEVTINLKSAQGIENLTIATDMGTDGESEAKIEGYMGKPPITIVPGSDVDLVVDSTTFGFTRGQGPDGSVEFTTQTNLTIDDNKDMILHTANGGTIRIPQGATLDIKDSSGKTLATLGGSESLEDQQEALKKAEIAIFDEYQDGHRDKQVANAELRSGMDPSKAQQEADRANSLSGKITDGVAQSAKGALHHAADHATTVASGGAVPPGTIAGIMHKIGFGRT